jgi:FkbM family methyltransferase
MQDTTSEKQPGPVSFVGPVLRTWQGLYRATPNFRGKGKVFFDWPSRFVRRWPSDVAVPSLEGCVFLHCNLNDFLYRHLFFFGLHELDVDWLCRRLLQSGNVFLDIGACYGYHALTAARRVGPRGVVYAIEPQPDVFETLRGNARHNEITNIELENFALSDQIETLQLQRFSDLDMGHTSSGHLQHPVSQVFSCPAVTLDEYIKQKLIQRVTLAKLDVEGAELKILRGARALLGGLNPPMWIVEVNTETANACGYHPRDLFSLLAEFGYQAYRPVWGKALRLIQRVKFCPEAEIEDGQNLLCAIPSLHADLLARVGAL